MRASSALALLVFAPAVASADEEAVFAIFAPRADGASAERLDPSEAGIRAALAARGIASPDRAALRARRDAAGDLAEARTILEEARRQFAAMDFEGSAEAYQRASAALEARHADLLGDPEMVEAAIGLARASLAAGRLVRAREEVRRALWVQPTLELDPADYPPDVVTLFTETRAEIESSVAPGPQPERMCAAARELGATHATTFELRRVSGRHELSLFVREAAGCTRTGTGVVQVATDDEPGWADAYREVTAQAVAPRPEVVIGPGTAGPATSAPAVPPPPTTPWYGRWYVWAGAGAVVTGVAAALLLPSLSDDSVQQHGLGIER